MNDYSPYRLEQAMSALLSVRQRLLEEDPDIAHDERLLADMLEGETGDAMEVLHRILRASVRADALANAAHAMADDMEARADRFRARREALRGAAFAALDALGLSKLELPDMTVSVKRGQPRVVVTDEEALPEAMIRVTRSPDKSLIGAALKAGNTVAGAELSNGLPSLQVRTK